MREPLRQMLGECRAQRDPRPRPLGGEQRFARIDAGQKIDRETLARSQIAGNLQDGRAGKAAMGEDHRLAEVGFARRRHNLARRAGQAAHEREIGLVEGQRHQRRFRRHHGQVELLGDAIGEAAGAKFRDGQSAGRDDEGGRLESLPALGLYVKHPMARH
jgi:hypothetical protein